MGFQSHLVEWFEGKFEEKVYVDEDAGYNNTWNLVIFPKQIEWQINGFTCASSESFNTYVILFSLRGRVELFVFPALPTRCIAEPVTVNK